MSSITSNNEDYTFITPYINGGWRALQIFNVYRLVLAISLLLISQLGSGAIAIGDRHPLFTFSMLLLYLFTTLLAIFFSQRRIFNFQSLATVLACLDIFMLIACIHMSSGMVGALGILITIVIAGNSLLLPGRLSLFFAALATTLLMGQELFAEPDRFFSATDSFLFGLLGASFFATAILAHVLSRRVHHSEAVASQRSIDLQNLERLNEHIIHRLHSGIMVVDSDWNVRVINQAAREIFNLSEDDQVGHISEVSIRLSESLSAWQADPLIQSSPFQTMLGSKMLVNFTPLERSGNVATLIFFEDMAVLSQQAQQMKLASLGRFTSSIAHELRNPLGAISYAVQLLEETPELVHEQQRLVTIISQHTHRMNDVINNILQLSRRHQTTLSKVHLKVWLENFVKNFSQQYLEQEEITLQVEPENFMVSIDPSQLQQIMTNLCENGLHAGTKYTGKGALIIRTGYTEKTLKPYLEILDNGPGIASDIVEKIFEPFYTTERKGTGLGLYIVNELCQANQASLTYENHTEAGACFRITFEK